MLRTGCGGLRASWDRDFLCAVTLERELHCSSPNMFKELLLLPGFCSSDSSVPEEPCWVWGWQGPGIEQLMGTEQ